jgi:drug/metabolite transporter (DMT)-like permease
LTVLAAVVALVAAACMALTSALQQRAARQEKPHRSLDPRLLLRLVRRPMWLASWAPDLAGTGLQALALRFGPLALVQPILVAGLFLAIPLEAALDRRLPHRRDLLAVGTGSVGLAVFLSVAQPRAGVPDPSRRAWVAVLAACAVAVAACVAAARFRGGTVRGTVLGVATGVLYGLTAALLKVGVTRFSEHPAGVFTDWHLYALIPVGIAALVLNQNAFQSGPLAAPLTALTLADPVVSIAIGLAAFHERLDTGGPRLAVEAVAGAAMAVGIWLSSTVRPAGDEARVSRRMEGNHP